MTEKKRRSEPQFPIYGPIAPCKGCIKPEKGATCHINCPEYNKYKAENEKARKDYKKSHSGTNDWYAVRSAGVEKQRRAHGGRR